MRGPRRCATAAVRAACTAVAVVMVVTVAGCASTVSGTGSVGSGAASPAPTSGPTGFPSSATPSAVRAPLADYLIAAPSDSQQGSSAWAGTTTPTVAAFVQHFYDPDEQTAEVARLQADGVTGIAHRLWLARGLQFDVVLLQFSSATGAQTRHAGVVAATTAEPGLRSTRPAIAGDVTEFSTTTADKLGNIASRAYAIKGDITVEVFLFSPKTFDQADLTTYTTSQVDKLP